MMDGTFVGSQRVRWAIAISVIEHLLKWSFTIFAECAGKNVFMTDEVYGSKNG